MSFCLDHSCQTNLASEENITSCAHQYPITSGCMFCLNRSWMKVWQHRWRWYKPRLNIKTAGLPGGPGGLKSEVEHVPERLYA